MAIALCNPNSLCSVRIPQERSRFIFNPKTSHFATKTKSQLLFPVHKIAHSRFRVSILAFVDRFSVSNEKRTDNHSELSQNLSNWVSSVASVLPGGSWWNLCDPREEKCTKAKPVTVVVALRRMWALIGDDRWIVFVAFGSLIIAAVSEISMPSILAASIFSAEKSQTLNFSKSSRLLVVLCFTSGVSSGLRSGCFGVANMILVKRIRELLYATLIFQDISFFDTEAVGRLTSRLGADCQRLSDVIGINVHLILRNAIQGTGALINLLTLSWPLAMSTLVICSILSAAHLVYGQYQKKAAKLTQEFNACANEVAEETLSMIRDVRLYGTEKKELERYKQWMDKLASISIRESAAYGFWNMSFSTLYRSTQVLAVLLGGMSIMTGYVSPEELTKYVLYCEWLIYATWRVVDNLTSLIQSIGASEKVFQLMDLFPSDQFLSKGVVLPMLEGNIQFENVSFHYPSRMTIPILDHVNLSVQASEVVAVVGLSGCGKSTLVNLLLRLYEPVEGHIYIDGSPLRDLDIKWLREQVGFVGQEPHLFRMDIKSNIAYGCTRDINQADIEWASKQAYAHEFINSFPHGYETLVDDDLLSGGQKQRIAIARAILRDPSVLILDEATSALDSESEHHVKGILSALRNNKKARTVIIIAHRLSTIKTADRIVVMNRGRIVEMGDHSELLLKGGFYAQLIKSAK